jgi:GxxExxY protein
MTITKEEEIMKAILDEAIYLHKSLGPGLLEKVYSTCLSYLLRKKGFYVETEKPIPIVYKEVRMECGYRADLVVENTVVVETKSLDGILPVHVSQVLTHLRFLDLRYGLLLNFNTVYLKDGIKRVLNGFERQA